MDYTGYNVNFLAYTLCTHDSFIHSYDWNL